MELWGKVVKVFVRCKWKQREWHKTELLKRLQPGLVHKNVFLMIRNCKEESHDPQTYQIFNLTFKVFSVKVFYFYWKYIQKLCGFLSFILPLSFILSVSTFVRKYILILKKKLWKNYKQKYVFIKLRINFY